MKGPYDTMIKKGKHAKKGAFPFFSIILVLLSISVLSTGMIIGWSIYTKEQARNDSDSLKAKQTLSLTPEEKKLSEKINHLLIKHDYIGSIYVKKNNHVIFERGYGYANKENDQLNRPYLYYQIGSIQKAMTALLILKQVELGHLSLNTKLAKFYPQIPNSQKISIEDLLYMRSGLKPTAKPTTPLSDTEVVQFAVQHLKLVDYHTYRYEPLNFTILAGILINLTHQPYEKLVENEIIKPLDLKQTAFYDQVKNSPHHALSYQMSASDDYWKPLTESQTAIHNELGTGNISMSVLDLNTFFTKVLSGKMIPQKLLFTLWKPSPTGHPYRGGVYCGNDYVLAQGNINRFHSVAVLKRDLKDAVVMESNDQSDKKIKLTALDLRNRIYNLIEGSKILEEN